jgi:hypothetical protein
MAEGRRGLEVVSILEAAAESLRQHGASVTIEALPKGNNGNGDGAGKDNNDANGRLVMPADLRLKVVA